MATKLLHFKWTTSKGQNTYGYNICTLFVDGKKKGSCMGGGYDMQGTSFAQWINADYQKELLALFASDIESLKANTNAQTYKKGKETVKHMTAPRFYGTSIYYNVEKDRAWVYLDGACGFSSIEDIAKAIGVVLQWNPESRKTKNHTYYTATQAI